ncbi:MAG: hypothetical protein AB1489_29080, partial [Acidobacteriota bacterium]
ALPTRCEVCHKSDYFDPITNACRRCQSVTEKELQKINKSESITILRQQFYSKLKRFIKRVIVETLSLLIALVVAFFVGGFLAAILTSVLGLVFFFVILVMGFFTARIWLYDVLGLSISSNDKKTSMERSA